MHYTYPEYTIAPEYMKLLKSWSDKDPISDEECKRYSIILATQKSINKVLHKKCTTNYPDYFKRIKNKKSI
jgi:endonuclease I